MCSEQTTSRTTTLPYALSSGAITVMCLLHKDRVYYTTTLYTTLLHRTMNNMCICIKYILEILYIFNTYTYTYVRTTHIWFIRVFINHNSNSSIRYVQRENYIQINHPTMPCHAMQSGAITVMCLLHKDRVYYTITLYTTLLHRTMNIICICTKYILEILYIFNTYILEILYIFNTYTLHTCVQRSYSLYHIFHLLLIFDICFLSHS